MKKTYSKDTPVIVRSAGKILVPCNVEDHTDSEGGTGKKFDYFEIDDGGQDIADNDVVAELTATAAKYTGVEFNGVMCSATAEDMWGLASIRAWIAAGNSANFYFENGNKLKLTADNIDEFEAVWLPFRQAFFSEEVS